MSIRTEIVALTMLTMLSFHKSLHGMLHSSMRGSLRKLSHGLPWRVAHQTSSLRVSHNGNEAKSHNQRVSRSLAVNSSAIAVTIAKLLSLGLAVAFSALAAAQPVGHAGHDQVADISGIAARTATTPNNDAVLPDPPDEIDFQFPEDVRLVKLVVRNEQRDWVDIEFRYSPRAAREFHWNLPALAPAVYYTVEWAALDRQERLVRGSFDFSFGPEAELPSLVKQAQDQLLQQRYGDPTIQYVPPPPTQIIIDRDPPNYDPPFTIDLADPDNP